MSRLGSGGGRRGGFGATRWCWTAALATELERRGADLRDRLWSARILLDDPDLIRAVHEDYFAAGADVAISASYRRRSRASRARAEPRTGGRLMRRSVELARRRRRGGTARGR
jgi:homocysteine S-methyltransferase